MELREPSASPPVRKDLTLEGKDFSLFLIV
jgi:hypothetical protein